MIGFGVSYSFHRCIILLDLLIERVINLAHMLAISFKSLPDTSYVPLHTHVYHLQFVQKYLYINAEMSGDAEYEIHCNEFQQTNEQNYENSL